MTVLWSRKRVDLLTRAIHSGADLARSRKDLFDGALAEARERAPAAIRSSFRVFDEARKHLRFVAHDGEGWSEELLDTLYLLDGSSSAAKVVDGLQPHYLKSIVAESHEWYRKLFDDVGALCSLPVFERERLFGVLTLDFGEPQEFPADQRGLLEGITQECTQVLDRLALIEDGWLLELNHKLDSAEPRSIENICEVAAVELQRIFGVRGCSVFVYDAKMGVLRLKGSTRSQSRKEEVRDYPLGVGLTGWTAFHQTTLRIRNFEDPGELAEIQGQMQLPSPPLKHEGYFDDLSDDPFAGPKTFLATALTVNKRLIGVIRLSAKEDDPVEFQRDDEVVLERIAGSLALTVENIQLHDEQRAFISRLEEIGASFTRTLRLDDLLTEVSKVAREYSNMDYAVLRVPTPQGRWKAKIAFDRRGESLLLRVQDEIDDTHPVMRQALSQKSPAPYDISNEEFGLYIADLPPSDYKDLLQQIKLIIVLPIRLQEEPLGMLCLSSVAIDTLDQKTLNGLQIITTYTALSMKLLDLRRTNENADNLLKALILCAAIFIELPHFLRPEIDATERIIAGEASPAVKLHAIGEHLNQIKDMINKRELDIVERAIAPGKVLDLAEVVGAFVESKKADLELIGTRIECRLSPCRVFCNELQLLTGLWLITHNAVRAINEAKREGHIQFYIQRNGKSALLAVTDNGTGMTPEQVDEVAIPHYPPSPDHHGISMPAVRIFMELHGGEMRVDSTLGQGTTVSLIFPAM